MSLTCRVLHFGKIACHVSCRNACRVLCLCFIGQLSLFSRSSFVLLLFNCLDDKIEETLLQSYSIIMFAILQVWKRKAEQYLADSGVPYTIIRYTHFYSLFGFCFP